MILLDTDHCDVKRPCRKLSEQSEFFLHSFTSDRLVNNVKQGVSRWLHNKLVEDYNLPKLIIDGIEVEVAEGTNVLEAAKKVGIVIPHFCYHPALGSVGACRLCAMKFIEGPVKGVQVSCMVKAADGMVVSTTDGDAARLRRMVIEWMMMNHPHDCPVCDEGGMCLLQDYTIAGGHGRRRYRGKKRTYQSQYLGEFIFQEMNRCIQCYRCSRFYQDYCGGTDFGTLKVSNKVFFGRHEEGWLESEFAGNLAEICPTGVFTDKTYHYVARPWDLETAPSVCPHCSLGCNTMPGARYRKLVKITARENQTVNGWFICDRGRFGYGFAGRKDRPYFPMIMGNKADLTEALDEAANRLSEAVLKHGGNCLALLGSPRIPLENAYYMNKFADAFGSANVFYSPNPERERKDRLAASLLKPELARSLKEIEDSDYIICAGVDPINEAPMLALMMRQAVRKGARALVIDPRPVLLPFEFTHLPVAPDGLADALTAAANDIKGYRPVIIVGTGMGSEELIEKATSLTKFARTAGKDCGLFYVMDGPNSFGNAILAGDEPDFDELLDDIEKGRVKVLVVAECDPLGQYPDRERVAKALEKLDSLIVMDYLPSDMVSRADVFLPTTAYAEQEGTFINNEGRAQVFGQAYISGVPINDMGPDAHPPRTFSKEVPGHSLPVWEILKELACSMKPECFLTASADAIRAEIAETFPAFSPLKGLLPGDGTRLLPGAPYKPPIRPDVSETGRAALTLIASELTFGTEELSTYSNMTQLRAPVPYVLLNNDDAARLGLEPGIMVEISSGGLKLECALRVSDKAAEGVAIAPKVKGFPVSVLNGKKVTIRAMA